MEVGFHPGKPALILEVYRTYILHSKKRGGGLIHRREIIQ